MKHFSWELTDYLYCHVIWFWRASCFYNVIKVQPFSRVFPQLRQRSIENKYKLFYLIYHSFAHILCNFADVVFVPILSDTWYGSWDGQQGWAQGDSTLGRGTRRGPPALRDKHGASKSKEIASKGKDEAIAYKVRSYKDKWGNIENCYWWGCALGQRHAWDTELQNVADVTV